MNDLDELVTRVRARGSMSLLLDGWDRASIWGWDEAIGSLYAHLWPNNAAAHKPSAIRIEPNDFTPNITVLPTLAQYIAMALNCDPWEVLTVLDRSVNQDEDSEDRNDEAGEGGTVATMTDGYYI